MRSKVLKYFIFSYLFGFDVVREIFGKASRITLFTGRHR